MIDQQVPAARTGGIRRETRKQVVARSPPQRRNSRRGIDMEFAVLGGGGIGIEQAGRAEPALLYIFILTPCVVAHPLFFLI